MIEKKELKKFIMIGDKVLIKPKSPLDRTKSGLYLPPNVVEKEKIQTGYVVKCGPGFPIPYMPEYEESWKKKENEVKYVPIQAQEGDLAVFLQNGTWEIEIESEKYYIVNQSSILMLIRDEDLFK